MIELDENDIEQPDKGRHIQNEIVGLRKDLIVPKAIQYAATFGKLGHYFIPTTGAVVGGLAGYFLGKKKELSESEKEMRKQKIQGLQQNLFGEQKKDEVYQKAADTGVLSTNDLGNLQFSTYNFDGEFFELMGNPAKPQFHCLIFGLPKAGKSIFSFQFANYLREKHGSVLYVAAEEGFGQTLNKKIEDWMTVNMNFSDKRDFEGINKICGDYDFVFIDSVNYSRLDVDDIEELKQNHPKTSFITVHQATKEGQFRGSQEFAHNCDMICKVENGQVEQKGRFQGSDFIYQIFKEK